MRTHQPQDNEGFGVNPNDIDHRDAVGLQPVFGEVVDVVRHNALCIALNRGREPVQVRRMRQIKRDNG